MIRFFDSIIKDSPFMGTLLICAIYGILLGILFGLATSKPKKFLMNGIRIVIMILCLPFLWKLFSVTFKSIFALFGAVKGIGWLAAIICFGILVTLAILIGSGIHKVFISKVTARIQKTPVFMDVLDFIKSHNTTAIYCCHDGVRVIYDQDPHIAANHNSNDNITCKTHEEYKLLAVPKFTSCCAIPVRVSTFTGDFLFSKYDFTNMEEEDAEHFLLAICKEVGDWKLHMYRKTLSYKEEDEYTSTLSGLGGNLHVSTRKTKSSMNHFCLLDWYGTLTPAREEKNKKKPDTPAKKLNQW